MPLNKEQVNKLAKIRYLRQRQKHNYVQAVFFVLLFGLSTYVLLQSPIFSVKDIEIIGRNEISQQELVKLSGVALGNNIFKLNLKDGQDKIQLLPAVKDVKITRKFPSTVVIQLTERSPVAFLSVGNTFVEIDAEGIYIRPGKMQEKSIPIITGCNVKDAKIGLEIKNSDVHTALQVIAELPKEMVNILSEIHIDGQRRVIVYTIHGVQGRFGYPEEIAQKGRIFLQVLSQLDDGQRIEYVDLTSFKLPVVKYG